MKDKELIKLINKYFQGETSLEEERVLQKILRESASGLPEIEEVKAVMSYIEISALKDGTDHSEDLQRTSPFISGSVSQPVFKGNLRRWVVAAAVAIVAGVGLSPLFLKDDLSVCSTMIACREDNSREVAFALMSSQLDAIGAASDEVKEEVMEDLFLMEQAFVTASDSN